MRTVLLILSGLALLGMLVPAVWGQARPPATGREPDPVVPSTAAPAPPPAAPASAGAAVIRYRTELLDKDRDGFVSREEAAAVPELLKAFDQLDENHDGRLDDRELERFTK